MKTNINVIVTVEDNGENDLIEQLRTVESFCKIKNQNGCELNNRKLTFQINSNEVFLVD
jgi:hypothetical protein